MKPTKSNTAQDATETSQHEIVLVPLKHLLAHPDLKNRPIDKGHVAELTESILRNGLDTPLQTWNGGADDAEMELTDEGKVPANYLIAGFHRRDALRELKKKDESRFNELFPEAKIPVVRRSGTLPEMIALQIRENANRKDPSLPELLPQLVKLRDTHKMKNVAIARAIGKSEAWVSRVFDIVEEGGEEAVAAAQEGKLSYREALAVADDAKKAKKAGKPMTKEEKSERVQKAVAKSAKTKGKGKSDKRVGAKTLYGRYKAMPKVQLGRKLTILEETFAYIAGESDELPAELQRDPAAEKKAPKKADKE